MESKSSYGSDLDNLKATELCLGLPGTDMLEKPAPSTTRGSKRAFPDSTDECHQSKTNSSDVNTTAQEQEASPPSKTQVVGWPPVRSYMRNSFLQARKADQADQVPGIYVKVSMDGAPYLRKTDLKMYKGYKELKDALEDMFKGFSLGDLLGMEGCNRSEYAVTYEDKDGDWMLVGDVPWEMFISSCKRLRIMRGSEARGLGSNS